MQLYSQRVSCNMSMPRHGSSAGKCYCEFLLDLSQVVTAERDALLKEVQTLQSKSHVVGIKDQSRIAVPIVGRTMSRKAVKIMLQILQIAALLAYFMWEDYGSYSQQK